jgi:hypothetical protein
MIPIKRKESYSRSLPRLPLTPTMDQQVAAFQKESGGMTKAEVQRRALDLFLSLVCLNWQTEYAETRQILEAYAASVSEQK